MGQSAGPPVFVRPGLSSNGRLKTAASTTLHPNSGIASLQAVLQAPERDSGPTEAANPALPSQAPLTASTTLNKNAECARHQRGHRAQIPSAKFSSAIQEPTAFGAETGSSRGRPRRDQNPTSYRPHPPPNNRTVLTQVAGEYRVGQWACAPCDQDPRISCRQVSLWGLVS